MPYRRTPGVQARLAASRDRILRAAIDQVAERGYAGCSVAAVAARAGVATGSVYRHFPGKADLVAEVFRVASAREVAAVALAARAEHTFADRITAAVTTFASRALRSGRLAYALLAEPVDVAVDAERLVFRRAYRDLFAEVLRAGVASGEVDLAEPHVPVVAAAVVGAIGEALTGPLSPATAGEPPPDLIPALVEFTLRAVSCPTSARRGAR